MKTSFTFGALVILLTASVTAQDYAIKMQQPLKVGQRYRLTAVASNSSTMSMTAEQQVLKSQKEELSVELESVATVLAVDAQGRPTRESHSIVKLLHGAAKEPLLAVGTTLLVSRRGEKKAFEIEGKPATGAVFKALELAVEITSGGATDDEVFGTKERKKVGDRWPVNGALALRDANEKIAAAGVAVTSLKGTTTLQNVTMNAGGHILHLASDLTAELAGKMGPLKSTDSTMTATFSGAFPQDLTKNVRQESGTITMTLKASGRPNPESPAVQLLVTMKRSASRQYKLLE